MFFDHSGRRVLGIDCRYVVVVVISVEEGLHAVASEEHRVLTHLLLAIVLPVTVRVLRIEIVLIGRHERRGDLLLKELIPLVVFEPYMVLDLLGSIKT